MWILEILETVQTYSQSVFHLSPVAIAVLGYVVARYKFKLFRESEPAIKAELTVYSRRCSESLIAVAAEAAVTNTSRVKVDIPKRTWSVKKIAPYHDTTPDAEWEECWREEQERLTLEPGETDMVRMRGRVDDHIEAIDVTLILDQPQKRRGTKPLYWVYGHPHNLNRS